MCLTRSVPCAQRIATIVLVSSSVAIYIIGHVISRGWHPMRLWSYSRRRIHYKSKPAYKNRRAQDEQCCNACGFILLCVGCTEWTPKTEFCGGTASCIICRWVRVPPAYPAGEYTTNLDPRIRIDEPRTSNAVMLAGVSYISHTSASPECRRCHCLCDRGSQSR